MSDASRAAVLVPLDRRPAAASSRIGFIHRSADSSTHAAHIGFPGGKPEPEDDSLCATAERETVEEVALTTTEFDVVASLDPHRTRSSDFVIQPFLGEVSAPERFRPASREVDETFWIPVSELRDTYAMDGDRIRYHARATPHEVWGVTARIVTSLLVTRLERLEWN